MDLKETGLASIGLDIGSVTIKGVALDDQGETIRGEKLTVFGSPARRTAELARRLAGEINHPLRFGVTGGGKGFFDGLPGVHVENDLVAVTGAVAQQYPKARGIIEIGGHQSKWIKLGSSGELDSFSINDQCAAGSGAFLEQQAVRLGLTIEEFSSMAAKADRGATVAGRCAVFAKSDMIHLQQKGTPPPEIAFGLCLALARNYRATLLRGGDLAYPTLFLGGGALNPGLYLAFLEVFGVTEKELLIAPDPQFYEAVGVARAGANSAEPISLPDLLTHLELADKKCDEKSARQQSENGFDWKITPLEISDHAKYAQSRVSATGEFSAYLGVDVGSVSTDFCLLSPAGEVLDGIYLRTQGNPIGVLGKGMDILRDRFGDRLSVLGLGATGSGRHLAGRLLGADVVKNEITCQLLGAKHVLPEVDTILEIGGQDSKYVSVRNGRIVDFVMNKICAAGTGSFLEEQGEALGVAIEEEFSNIAMTSMNSADLGSQCTVFMDAEVVNARRQGGRLSDILAGLARSVTKNYLERVVSGREIGENVVFQGGVASNQAVIAAFEQLLGKPVTIHPHNLISGAIGAAVAAMDKIGEEPSGFRGLGAVKKVKARTFECSSCSNMCQVARIDIGEDKAFFGDVCEKFSSRVLGKGGDEEVIPDLVGEVEELLESYAGGEPEKGIAGIPRASMMYDLFPYWATFLKKLGFKVVLPGRSNMSVLEQGTRRLTAETCLPIKLVYGHVSALFEQKEADFVFLPAVIDVLDGAKGKSFLCPFEENAGFMVETFAADKVVIPTVSFASSRARLVLELREKLSSFGFSKDEISAALDAARKVQDHYHANLRERGKEVLADHDGLAFALLGKPYNIVDAFENLNLSRHLRKLGVLPVPMQMLPDEPVDLEARGFTVPWKYNRDIAQAMEFLSRNRRLFPVVISNFGCGPDAFAMKFLGRSVDDQPFLFLEFDEHRGEAGLVTRLEAFIDEVSNAAGQNSLPARKKPHFKKGTIDQYMGRRMVMPLFADHAWAFFGAMKFAGLEPVILPPPDQETMVYGEKISSGKECHPYAILAGDLMKHLDHGTIRNDDLFFFPGTAAACLLHQYGNAMQLILDRQGIKGVEVITPNGTEQFELFGLGAMTILGRGMVVCDQLQKLKRQIRPYAVDKKKVDKIFADILPLLADKLAEDRLGDVLKPLIRDLEKLERNQEPQKPVVGVAGDPYTRIHPFGNTGMFDRLEELGLEVWPAPFLLDVVEFAWRRNLSEAIDDSRFMDAAGAAGLFVRKKLEELRVRFLLSGKVLRAEEPGYKEALALAAPYINPGGNRDVLMNVAKMAHFARNGAHGIINAIAFHCMLGTVSASMTERIRRDHEMIPIINMMYTGKPSVEIDARLEAFAHQVKGFSSRKKEAG